MIAAERFRERLNNCGRERIPVVFGIDYEKKEYFLYQDPFQQRQVFFSIRGIGNESLLSREIPLQKIRFEKRPISYQQYKEKFEIAYRALAQGDSFLLNLTIATPLDTNLDLADIFLRSQAPYKVYLPSRFVCFSPEGFVQIADGRIRSFPMKGTIRADIANAEQQILNDYKERCEHYTIVDLIRNDLNQVGEHTRVKRFRYIDRVETMAAPLLQVSSEIESELPSDYLSHLGDILLCLLPAGSISGAPKRSTVETLARAESVPRGFYTGIIGYFDGEQVDTGVLIRYIEQTPQGLVFRSGGGITINSSAYSEYCEAIEKVYLPI